jgi:hypothetical protein
MTPEIAYGRSVATPGRAAKQFVIMTLAWFQQHESRDHETASAT